MDAIVDANVFLHGSGTYPFERALIVQSVYDEIKSSKGLNNIRNVEYGIYAPSEKSLSKVVEKSEEINSPTSEADESLLALAIDRKAPLVTDDIPLQNLALHLGVEFQGYFEDEIDEKFEWKMICKTCGAQVKGKRCGNCGSSSLRRKQVCCS